MFKLKLKKSFSLVLASIISSFSIFYVFASDPVTADSSSS
ncbi:MAG: hypothetical protein ACI93V_000723, partial [Alteromonadaceae bacterium]